jgi:hypothetical protein
VVLRFSLQAQKQDQPAGSHFHLRNAEEGNRKMTKQQLGKVLQFGGYGSLGLAAIVAGHHPVIITLLVIGTGAFFLGRALEKSV